MSTEPINEDPIVDLPPPPGASQAAYGANASAGAPPPSPGGFPPRGTRPPYKDVI